MSNNIRWMRTATIANGKFLEAIAWSKEISATAQNKWGAPTVNTWIDAFGNIGTIRWSTDYADLASLEKVQTAMMMDPSYHQLVQKAFKDGLFVDGSGVDNVFRLV